MTESFSDSIGNGLDLVASRTASNDFNFSSVDSKYDGAKLTSTRSSVKRETPPISLLLPQLSESRLPGFSSSLCDVFDASPENHAGGNTDRNHQPRQSVSNHSTLRQSLSSHSTQQNQCGVSLLKADNFSLSYSFRSQDTESNKSPVRDKHISKKETDFYRDDFDHVREIYDDSPENSSKSKRGASSSVQGPSSTNTASIFRQRNDTSAPMRDGSYGDRREKPKTSSTVSIRTSRVNERIPNAYDERKDSPQNRVPTNSSFEDVQQNQKPRNHPKTSTSHTIDRRLSNSPTPAHRYSRGRSMVQGRENASSPTFLNSSFDVCLSDTDKFLGSLPLEGTFNSFGNEVGNDDTPNKTNISCQDYKTEGRENVVSLNRRRHPGALVDDTADESNITPQHRETDSRKGAHPNHASEFSDTLVTTSPESDHRSDALNIYMVIRTYTKAFSDFSFLLPGLKDSTVDFGSQHKHQLNLSARDIFIAKRRLASAVCAFGGFVGQKPKPLRDSSVSSIFRTKCDEGNDQVASRKTRSRVRYEQKLPLRYYENEDRLSWEVEEHPPLETITDDEDEDADVLKPVLKNDSICVKSPSRDNDVKDHHDVEIVKSLSDDIPSSNKLEDEMKEEQTDASATSSVSTSSNSGETPKMKYRCKLCGQPKQNHTCPYQQSLQRSIGTMSYPALNAFDANEPGEVAPTLSEMNNFVPGEDEQLQLQTPPRPKSNPAHDSGNAHYYEDSGPNTVTPETRDNRIHNSSAIPHNLHITRRSPLSSGSPLSSKNKPEDNTGQTFTRVMNGKRRRTAVYSSQQKPRSRDISNDRLFLETMEIKPEQFRVVTPSKDTAEDSTYKYPMLPLTYGQRKKMSDSLFTLSKEVKGLTDECADVLRDARETDSWDLAVAELMAQIIVVLHCPKGDNRLKGLQRYLVTLGISC